MPHLKVPRYQVLLPCLCIPHHSIQAAIEGIRWQIWVNMASWLMLLKALVKSNKTVQQQLGVEENNREETPWTIASHPPLMSTPSWRGYSCQPILHLIQESIVVLNKATVWTHWALPSLSDLSLRSSTLLSLVSPYLD